MQVRLLFNDLQNSYNPCTAIDINLAPPCFQWCQLSATACAHGRNMCSPLKQHGCLLCVWALESFVWSVSKLRERNCKLHDTLMPLHIESDSCNCLGEGIFSREESLKKLCIFVFSCEENILLTLFGNHIFPSGD